MSVRSPFDRLFWFAIRLGAHGNLSNALNVSRILVRSPKLGSIYQFSKIQRYRFEADLEASNTLYYMQINKDLHENK